MIKYSSLIAIIFYFQNYVRAYDFTNAQCRQTTKQQSPIDIITDDTFYYEEKYFRFLTNQYKQLTENNTWTVLNEERAVGFVPTTEQVDFGSFILVKDWAMHNFLLNKILFRVKSEHTINGETFDVEMQLVHSLDHNYIPPGRSIALDANYLVISVFFKVTPDSNPARSELFQFMNLEGFASGTSANIAKSIKLHHIIQHQPSYLYQGTLTYPGCEDALWLIFSNFHLITQTDYNNLVKVINSQAGNNSLVDSVNGFNARDVHINIDAPVYRNWKDPSAMRSRVTLMTYNSSSTAQVSLILTVAMIISVLFA